MNCSWEKIYWGFSYLNFQGCFQIWWEQSAGRHCYRLGLFRLQVAFRIGWKGLRLHSDHSKLFDYQVFALRKNCIQNCILFADWWWNEQACQICSGHLGGTKRVSHEKGQNVHRQSLDEGCHSSKFNFLWDCKKPHPPFHPQIVVLADSKSFFL